MSGDHCLSIISSKSQKRNVYFDNAETLEYWHKEILRCQGYLDKRIDAYEPIRLLGKGSFGNVSLSRHRNSKVKFAVKVISKA